jgi:hypothetical protein
MRVGHAETTIWAMIAFPSRLRANVGQLPLFEKHVYGAQTNARVNTRCTPLPTAALAVILGDQQLGRLTNGRTLMSNAHQRRLPEEL